ncbi:MAG: PTS sugar transporter subunit IIA [Candidatus Omnitrophica bacterium]|nr:PTS sugar transporter subunit IIA [Candidatus Omnitrophota bacterium]
MSAEKSGVRLTKLIKEKCIELELKEKTKNKLLDELVGVLAGSGKLKDKKAFLGALTKREKLGSTGIGNGVAIPHAKSEKVKDFILAFGRHEEGVDFGALDGEKTYLFFALASPAEDVGNHLKILAEISKLVKDKFIVENLKVAKTKKDILKIISTYG